MESHLKMAAHTLISHNIKTTCLILCGFLLCGQNSSDLSRHGGGGVLRECSYHEGAYLVHNGVWMHWVCQVASTGMPRPKVSRQNVALLREGQCYWYHLSVALMLWLIGVDAMLWNIISNCFPLILLECSPFYFRVLFFWVLLAWLAERRSAER